MLEVIVFVCGAVVMILEMVGSRILAPYLGTSIVVWTSLIGIILGSLSLGYWWGGRIADRRPGWRPLSTVILLSAVSVGLIALSKTFILEFLQKYAGSVHLGSTTATLLLFTPPSVLLGMVTPLSVRLKMHDVDSSGRTVGGLYAISTLGSIFGTFFAGFYLIAFFGSTTILIVMALVLTAVSLLASVRDRLVKVAAMALLVLGLIGSTAYDAHLASLDIHDVDTDYSRILVYRSRDVTGRDMRVMVTNPGGVQSGMYLDDETDLALQYTRFYRLAPHFRPDMRRVLMLGGGGYSFPKYAMSRYQGVTMDVVEIDPGVTELARRFFALKDTPGLRIVHEDARTFLNKATGTYDVILGDTFSSHHSIPFHMTTIETVRRLHDLLDERGVVLMNILSAIEGDLGRFLRAEYATFKAVFPQVLLFPVTDPDDPAEWQNIMLVALKSPEAPSLRSQDPDLNRMLANLWTKPVPNDLPPFTDEFAPVDRYITLVK